MTRVYERHAFICTTGNWCPEVDGDGIAVYRTLKRLVARDGVGDRVRINESGCFSQCGHGPMVVVYPDGVWYAAVEAHDAEAIYSLHLLGGEPVERLRYRPTTPGANKLARDKRSHVIGSEDRGPSGAEAAPLHGSERSDGSQVEEARRSNVNRAPSGHDKRS